MRGVLGDPNYRLYLAGNLASTIGIWTQRVAIGWLTWELTHSTAWLGIIALAESGPTIIFGFVAGAMLDRADHLKVLRVTQALFLGYSVLLATLTIVGLIEIWSLTALVVFRGAVFAFNRPARQTVVYGLAGRDRIVAALALNATVFNSSKFTGPALGGILLVSVGIGWAMAASAALLFVFTVVLRIVIVTPVERKPREERSLVAEIVDGLRYVVVHPPLLTLFALLIGVALFAKPVTDLMPGFAADVFGRGPQGLAILLGVHGVGAMLAGFWLSARVGISGLTRLALAIVVDMGVVLLVFALTDVFWLACALMFAAGFCFVTMDIACQTLIQSGIRSRYRGRTISLYGMISQGMPSSGALVMGIAAEHFGLQLTVMTGGILCLVMGIGGWIYARQVVAELERPLAP